MTENIRATFNSYKAGFLQVLIALEAAGIKGNQEEAPASLGITRREFNRLSQATAVALREQIKSEKAYALMHPDEFLKQEGYLIDAPAYLTSMINIHELLVASGADVHSNKGFKPLGTTKQSFGNDCRESLLDVLVMLERSKAEFFYRGGWDMSPIIKEGMNICGIDPLHDGLYQQAGFESCADFQVKQANWQKMAAENPRPHQCCDHDHHGPQ